MMHPEMRPGASGSGVLFVQTGDFRETVVALGEGKPETYRDQSRSVGHLVEMARHRPVTVVCRTREPYRTTVAGVSCIGLTQSDFFGTEIAAIVGREGPTLAIVRSPVLPVLHALIRADATVLCTFADVFSRPRGLWPLRAHLKEAIRRARLARALQNPRIVAVGNHGRFASRSLVEVMGLSPDRVIPWEWTPLQSGIAVSDHPARAPARIAYAGALSEDKGVHDLLQALAHAIPRFPDASLDIFGQGHERPALEAFALSLGIGHAVTFRGSVPNTEVRQAFSAASAVVVPSRHSYPEGVPNVIFEALAERVPLIITDHPAFSGNFRDGETALIVPERDPTRLSQALGRIWTDPALAARLAASSAEALEGLYLGPSWYDLVDAFIADPTNRSSWVQRHTLAALD